LVVIAQCIEETTQALEALGSNLFAQLALDALGRLARGRQVVEGPMGKRDPLDPTYQSDTFKPVNTLARPSAASPQVRYWSLCIVLKDLHTEDCLRDEQVRFPAGSRRFTAIVPPTCPGVGYSNCLFAGSEPLQVSLAYRYVLPRSSLKPMAFRGNYDLVGRYVGRPE